MESALIANKSVKVIHPCYELHDAALTFANPPSISCVSLYIFLGLMSVITVCGNLLVVVSIVYFRQLHTPTNYLILSLAVADLLVGVLVFPSSMTVTVTSCWYQEDLFCKLRGSFDVTLSTASILNLCCISLDRYYAVCKPLTYRSQMSHRVIGMMILASWGVSALIGIGIIVAGFNQGKLIVMLSFYLKIFFVAQKQVKSIQSTTCQNSECGTTVSRMERKATKTLAVVMGVFIFCWAPYFLCIIFQPLTYEETPVAVIETLNWLTLSNSMLNPFIYAFFYTWFRSAIRMIISGKIFQGNHTNTTLF
ncbi:trace amine-associated receptor 1 [Oryzias melastigma]|uniref:G-protein coupled receptors family 1 profile domain-containing protein n=1 Tax=Oryzias melastigma TaxID=30732 RepID=A0A3B3DI44_ORYME|nr:trace amine-associated receptor 1 [Oryzias melastigma]